MKLVARASFARLLIGAGALGLLVSLFLTWSSTGLNPKDFLVIFGAVHHLRDDFGGRSGWQTYPVGAALLAALAVLLGLTVVVRDTRARLVAALIAVGALAFPIAALVNPPHVVQQGQGGGGFSLAWGSSAGVGEIVAITSLASALVGLALISRRPRSEPGRWSRIVSALG